MELILLATLMAQRPSQHLTEMSNINFPGVKGSQHIKFGNLTTICEPIV
jgi:hypothetical protein